MSWTKYLKTGIASAAVVLLGIIVMIAFGFNKSFDFTGGTIVSVNAKTASAQDATKLVNEVMADHNNINVASLSVGSSNGEAIITVKYQISKDIDATNDAILEELYAAFGYDAEDFAEKNYINMTTNVQPAYNNMVFAYALMGVLVGLIAAAFYMFLRMGFASAMVLVASVIIDVIVAIAFMSIFRIGVSANIGFAVLGAAVLSVIFNTMMLHKLKANSFEPANKKASNAEVADQTRAQLFRPFIIFAAGAAIALLVFAIIAFGPAGSAVLAVAISLASIFVTSIYINPTLWEMVFVRKVREKRKPMPEIESEEG
ncbi:MAG: hypothetical protein IKK20_00345 [Clostridia bacterium]|nr:hypothetical protein [Clostridia bacterium]MBR2433042.1 hypothetical protein [Clostridia bacterium]MBR3790241.1 hypothetical protein [Clostridia bacterium]